MARFVKLRPKLDNTDPFLEINKVYLVKKEGVEWTEHEDQIQIRFGEKKHDIGWFWESRFDEVDEQDVGVDGHLAIIKEETKK